MSLYKIEASTGQHIGDRSEQQDRIALLAAPRAPGYMMAVLADGMGGAGGGSIAAEQAVRTARQVFESFSPLTDTVESMLQSITSEVHTVIQLMTLSSERRPRSTLAMLVLTPEHAAVWGHVGDSRIYRFSGPNLGERTIDHTQGPRQPITTATAAANPKKSLLVNVLGDPAIQPVLSIGGYSGIRAGDAFMLCSDGLWAYCSDAECGAAIAMNPPRDAAQMLIHKARERTIGANADNISVAVIKLVKPPKEISQYQVDKMRRAV